MAEQISRRHHTIPKFLLTRFADERGQLKRVVLPGDKRHMASVKDASVHNGFYLLLNEDGRELDGFERYVGTIESAAAEAIRRVVDMGQFPPSVEDRTAIAALVALQHLRTPAIREHHRELDDHVFKANIAVQGREGARRVLRQTHGREPSEEEIDAEWAYVSDTNNYQVRASPGRHIHSILQLFPGTTAQFRDRAWMLMRWQRRGLVITDTPVLLHQEPENRGMGLGLATADAVFMALDRRALLRLSEIGESDTLAYGTTAMARDLNQNFVLEARQAFFHHPGDTAAVDKLQLPGPTTSEVEAGASFEDFVRMGEAYRQHAESSEK